MNRLFSKVFVCKWAAAALLTSAALIVTGCGLDTAAAPLATSSDLGGKAIGGNTPIVGATVKLYATTSSNSTYGTGSFLEEATQRGASAGQDTDASGDFSFNASGYTCPAGQFAYITLAGGNTGANSVNSSSVLVAALGRCEDIGSHTFTIVNELSTIAAAYALGHFSSVSGTGASTVVSIGSSSTNNAVAGAACVANGTTCTTTVASGLAHAFLNAASLVNITGGVANTTVPSSLGAVVPRELINSLGNVLVACVNSSGGTAPGGVSDGTACGNIFAATAVPGTTPVPPTNTFSAMVNLAANPTLNGSTAAVASFLGYATPATTIYGPALAGTTGLNDYGIAINYPASAYTALSFPMSGALDINDNYYVGNATYNTASAGNPTTPINVLSFSSNGTTYGSSATNTTFKAAFSIAVDAKGDGYLANGGGSGTSAIALFPFSNGVTGSTAVTTAGVLTTAHSGNLKVYSLAVDQANNVWAWGIQQANGTDNLYMNPGPYTSATAKTWVAAPGPAGAITVPTSNFLGLSIDPNQNVWMSTGTSVSTTSTLYVVENNGTVTAPTYTGTLTTKTTGGSPANSIAFAAGSTAGSYVGWVSSYNSTPGIQSYTPVFDTNLIGISNVTAGTLSQPASLTGSVFSEADGAGAIWIADTNSSSVQQYNTAAGTAYKFLSCLGGSTTCSSIFTTIAGTKPESVSIDSTGSIWVVSPPAGSSSTSAVSGNVVQIIGAAAPTWPLLSVGKTGTP